MNGDTPATQQDIAELRFAMKLEIEQLRSDLRHHHDNLAKRINDIEIRSYKLSTRIQKSTTSEPSN